MSAIGIASLIGAAASVAATGYNHWQNKRSRQWQEDMTQESRDYQDTNWEKTNAYNSPAAQMQRLREAGLNPNLMYGEMSSSAATAQPSPATPSTNVPSADVSSLGAFNNLPLMDAQKDKLETDIDSALIQSVEETINRSELLFTNFSETTQQTISETVTDCAKKASESVTDGASKKVADAIRTALAINSNSSTTKGDEDKKGASATASVEGKTPIFKSKASLSGHIDTKTYAQTLEQVGAEFSKHGDKQSARECWHLMVKYNEELQKEIERASVSEGNVQHEFEEFRRNLYRPLSDKVVRRAIDVGFLRWDKNSKSYEIADDTASMFKGFGYLTVFRMMMHANSYGFRY